MTKPRIGFIGMGIMGSPMVINLLKAGYTLIVNSRTKAKANDAINAGASWVDTPAECAKNVDIVITCVTDTPDVKNILLGPNGVIQSAQQGLICVDMSTISPEATIQMSQTLNEKGITLIDAPISGGQIGATEAKLSIMMGGPDEAIQTVMPVMQAMGRTITHCGQVGSGQKTKLVNQVMIIHTIMSISEGFAFAEKMGLDSQTTWQVTSAGAAGSHSLKTLGAKIIAGDLKPAFMVDLQIKDLKLAMEYAEKLKQPLPGTALAKQLMQTLQAQGRGKDGTQALVDVIRQLGNQ